MLWKLLLAIFLVCVGCSPKAGWVPHTDSDSGIYPRENWQKADKPEALGWSSEKLASARHFSTIIGSDAVMIVDDGVVVDAWGDISRNFQCHSMRKSILSALIGICVDEGTIDLAATIEQLGIDDRYPSLLPAMGVTSSSCCRTESWSSSIGSTPIRQDNDR